jgi:cell division protein FtsQ
MSVSTSVPPLAGEDEQPTAPRRDRRRLLLLAVAVTVLLAVVLTWVIAFSSIFGVRTVAVRGTHLLSVTQVRQAADLAGGTPLVRVDTADVTRRVEKLADVAGAQVSTSFPSTVTITITERQPVGYVRSHGHDVLIDRTGAHYRTVAKAPKDMPKFVLPTGGASAAASASVAMVATDLPASLRPKVRSIQALDPNAITLVLRQGQVIQWGNADRSADKARVLPTLLKHHVSQVDVTDPDQPFTR